MLARHSVRRVWAVRHRSRGMPNQHTSGHVTCTVRFFSRKFQYIWRGSWQRTLHGISAHFSVSLLWLRTFGLGDLVEDFDCLCMTAVYVIRHSPQHTGVHNPHKRSLPFLCRNTFRCTEVRRSDLCGGRGDPVYPGVRFNDGKLHGVGSVQNIGTQCWSGTLESGNIVPNIIIITIIICTLIIPKVNTGL